MTFGKDYRPRIAERPPRDMGQGLRGSGRNLVHAADHNDRVTLEALRRAGALTRQDLTVVTGLTAPGISNIMRRLLDAGLVRQVSGTRATRFAIEAGGAYGMGIDVEGAAISTMIVDLKGDIRLRERRHAASDQPADIAAALRASAFATASRLPAAVSDRLLGIGVTSTVDPDRIAQALAPFLVIQERDTACAALGERLLGSAPADGSFVQVLFGKSVRAGLMIRGGLFDGAMHRAGRIGQMRTGEDGRLLDDAAQLGELAPLLAEHFDRAANPDDFLARLDPHAVLAVENWLDRSTSHFLDAVIAISGFIAPSAIFVGGRLPGDLVDRLAARLSVAEARRMSNPKQPQWLPQILPATLRSDCVVLGAAILPFLEFLLPDPRRPPELRGRSGEGG
jgi:predicted NBD/HSP70 family sugar kinase